MDRQIWVPIGIIFVLAVPAALLVLQDAPFRGDVASEEMALEQAEPAGGFMAAKAPAAPSEIAPSRGRAPSQAAVPVPSQRKIIRHGNLSLEVESVEEALAKIKALVKAIEGYVSGETVSEDQYSRKSGTISCRIPAEDLDRTMEQIKALGELENVSVHANDITEEYYDLEIRIANQKALETRLLALLQRQTQKLSDLLDIERELARVRTEIESMEGRKRLWDSQVTYSTLVVSVREPLPVVVGEEGGPWRTLTRSFGRAADNFVLTVAGIVAFSGAFIPIAGLGLGIWLMWRVWARRRKTVSSKPGASDESH